MSLDQEAIFEYRMRIALNPWVSRFVTVYDDGEDSRAEYNCGESILPGDPDGQEPESGIVRINEVNLKQIRNVLKDDMLFETENLESPGYILDGYSHQFFISLDGKRIEANGYNIQECVKKYDEYPHTARMIETLKKIRKILVPLGVPEAVFLLVPGSEKKKVRLSPEAKANKKAYNKTYSKEHFKGKNLIFNTSNPEDMALLDWIQGQETGTQYIKNLIRKDMERAKGGELMDESQFSILPYIRTTRPCQIPVRAARFRYLTKVYKPGEDGSEQVMFHHPGHFVIYSQKTRQCIADATYAMCSDDDPENLQDDEIAAIIFEIRTMPEEDNGELPEGWSAVADLVREE